MKKPPVVVILLLVLSQLSLPSPSSACFVSIPLWDVVRSADLVVVARVVRVDRDDAARDPRAQLVEAVAKVATLEVTDVWKGSPPAELRVTFEFGAPPHYVPGAVVVVFLESGETRVRNRRDALASWDQPAPIVPDEWAQSAEYGDAESDAASEATDVIVEDTEEIDSTPETEAIARAEEARFRSQEAEEIRSMETWTAGRWFPIGMSYSPDARWAEDQDGIGDLVRRAAALQESGPVSASDRRAWLVTAVDHPVARREALWDLLTHKSQLSKDDFSKLSASFLRAPAVDDSDVVMLRLFAGHADLDVDRAAAAVVEAGIRLQPVPAWVVSMVEETLRRYGDDFAARIGRDDRDAAGRMIYTGPGENSLWTIWEVARRDLGIPQMPPAPIPERPDRRAEAWFAE